MSIPAQRADGPARAEAPDVAPPWWSPVVRVGLLVACALVVAREVFAIVTASLPALLGDRFGDDAFYYLALAQHFPDATVGGGAPETTGFHPLYWVVLAPVATALDPEAATRVVALGNLALWLVGAVALGLAVARLSRRWLGEAATAVAVLAPLGAVLWGVGTEASVYLVTLALVLLVVARATPAGVARCGASPGPAWGLVLGGSVGLAFLARTDSPLFTAPLVAVALVWRWYAEHDPARRVRVSLAAVGLAAVGFGVAVSPWLLFAGVDALPGRQDSSQALRELYGLTTSQGVSRVASQQGVYVVQAAVPARLDGAVQPVKRVTSLAGWCLLVLVAVLAWRTLRNPDASIDPRRPEQQSLASVLLAGIAGVVVQAAAYALGLGAMRVWYAVPTLVVVVLGVAFGLGRIGSATVGRTAVAVLAVFALAVVVAPRVAPFPAETDKLEALRQVEARGLASARPGAIAALNSGIYNYFSDAGVLNIDGVVNGEALDARRSGELCEYLDRSGVRYLLDTAPELEALVAAEPRIVMERRVVLDPPGGRWRGDEDQVLAEIRLVCT